MKNWIWRNLAFALPDDWEMLQFSRNPVTGKCAFADRKQFRFEMDWRHVPGRPDFDRMISDYMNRLVERGMRYGHRVSSGSWVGLEGEMAGRNISRFGWFSQGESCVMETVFLWPGARDKELEGRILSSFRESAPDAEGRAHWRAFGMDVAVPRGWLLHKCRVEPAFAEMIFRDNKRRRGEVRFSRRGIVDQWLKDPVERWLKAYAGDTLETMAEPRINRAGGHEKVTITGMHRAPGLFGRRRPGRAEGWICPRDGRLYNLIAFGGCAGDAKLECCEGA